MRKTLAVLLASLFLWGCSSTSYNDKDQKVSEDNVRETIESYMEHHKMDDYQKLLEFSRAMEESGQTDSLYRKVNKILEDNMDDCVLNEKVLEDYLMEGHREGFPVYLDKNDELSVYVSGQYPLTVRLYNADSQELLQTKMKTKHVEYVFTAPYSAIYLVEVEPSKKQYATIALLKKVNELDRLIHQKGVEVKIVEGTKSDFRSFLMTDVEMQNLFEEPRKFTLRGKLKSMFSGSSRAVVAIQLPQGATELLYSLRISTSESDKTTDGKFCENMNESYRQVKMFGVPIYESNESEKKTGLLSKLLDDNRPLREEDAYCNMYVFESSSQAKKFQDGDAVENLKYNIDYSTLGTQSCNGRIPVKGKKTVYLGFENGRVRYSNYLWVEALSAVFKKGYYHAEYSVIDRIEKEKDNKEDEGEN